MSDIGIFAFSTEEIAGFFFVFGFVLGAAVAGTTMWLLCRRRKKSN